MLVPVGATSPRFGAICDFAETSILSIALAADFHSTPVLIIFAS
jgi:hypothetical protein